MTKKALYLEIEDYILSRIKSKEYKIGDLIPSERELCQIFDASRSTVNKALSNLNNKGYLYRTPGRGSFVRAVKTDDDFTFVNWIQKMVPSSDIQAIAIKEKATDVNSRFYYVSTEGIALNKESYEQRIELLNYENKTIGLYIVTAHTEELTADEHQLLNFDQFANSHILQHSQYKKRFIVSSNANFNKIKQLTSTVDMTNFPLHIDVLFERENEIKLSIELYLQVQKFSFSF